MAIAPLMHGASQWATFGALFTGNKIVLYGDRSFDADAVWRIIEKERVQTLAITGDAMARPLIEALAGPSAGRDVGCLFVLASTAAVFSPSVKQEFKERFPNLIVVDSVGASETGFHGTSLYQAGESATARTGVVRVRPGRDTLVVGDDGRPLAPGSGVGGQARPHRQRAARLLQGPEEDGRDLRRGGRPALRDPRRFRDARGRRDASCCSAAARSASTRAARRSSPRRSRPRSRRTRTSSTWWSSASAIRAGANASRPSCSRAPGRTPTLDALAVHCRNKIAGYKIPRSLYLVERIERSPSGKPDYPWAKALASRARRARVVAPRPRRSESPMRTELCETFGIDVPIFAFSHCRDVVAAVSQAGGFGVLGALAFSPEQLEIELRWIDEHIGGKPYGVDVVMPASYARGEAGDFSKADLEKMLPERHKQWIEQLLARYEVPKLPDTFVRQVSSLLGWSESGGRSHVEIALKHPIKLLVNALGPPPKDVIDQAHAHGVRVAALVGSVAQARKQAELGVDVIVAQGWEAGGHTGDVSSMVLIPEVVDAVSPLPVLAAGGIGCGRQAAAGLALGAQGVWTGSIWLTVAEADASPVLTDKLLHATSRDTVRSRSMTGKPARLLRTPWTEAWDGAGFAGPPADAASVHAERRCAGAHRPSRAQRALARARAGGHPGRADRGPHERGPAHARGGLRSRERVRRHRAASGRPARSGGEEELGASVPPPQQQLGGIAGVVDDPRLRVQPVAPADERREPDALQHVRDADLLRARHDVLASRSARRAARPRSVAPSRCGSPRPSG